MGKTDLGKWMITNGGEYSADATYEQLTMVKYGNSTYITLKTVTGITPTDDKINYQLMAQGFDATALSAVQAEDTQGLCGEKGEIVTAQSLVDALADKVMNTVMEKIGTAALTGGMTDLSSGVNSLYSNLTSIAAYKEFYFSKAVPTKTQIEIGTFSVTSGVWLLIGFMDWDANQSSVYSFILNGRNVRAEAKNGGGTINVLIAKTSTSTTIPVAAYHAGSATMTARSRIYAIKLG